MKLTESEPDGGGEAPPPKCPPSGKRPQADAMSVSASRSGARICARGATP
jgi:hypothetical protein